MARTFDGSDDVIHCSLGALTGQTAAGTFVVVARRGANSTFHTLVGLHNSGGSNTLYVQLNPSNNLIIGSGGGEESSMFTTTTSDGWCLLAVTKASGSATPRFHRYVYSTNTWTHQDGGSSIDNGSSPGSGGTYRTAWQTGDLFNGDLAAVGIWDTPLSDAQIECLAHSLMQWYGMSPKAFWLFDQSSTTQPVMDLTGGGANQSSLTGTTVATLGAPIGYGHPVLNATTALVSSGGDTLADVTYVGGASGQTGSTTFDLTWPSVDVGDQALLWWNGQTGLAGGFTTPSGFSLVQAFVPGSGSQEVRLYRKTCTGSEDGSTLAMTMGTANKHCAVLSVYRGIDETDPIDAHSPFDETVSGTVHTCPDVTPDGTDAVIVTCVAERLSDGSTNYTTSYTKRQQSTNLLGGGGTIIATADDGLSVPRTAGVPVSPASWTGTVANSNLVTWSVALRRKVIPGGDFEHHEADTVELTDEVDLAIGLGRTVSDDVGLDDEQSFVADYQRTISDTAGLDDPATMALRMPRSVSDVLDLTDAVARALTSSRTVNNNMTLTDEISFLLVQFVDVDDDMELTDLVSKRIARTVPTDDAGLDDDVDIARIRFCTHDEAVGIADSVSMARTSTRIVNDVENLTDTVERKLGRIVSDSAGLADTTRRRLVRTLDQEDVGLADALSLKVNKGLDESVGLTDASSVVAIFSRTRNENAGLADHVVVAAVFRVTKDEDLSLNDVLLKKLVKGFSEDVGLSDELLLKFNLGIDENVGTTDSFSRVVNFPRSKSDDLGLSDDVLVGRHLPRSFDEDAGLDDSQVIASRFPRSFDEDAGLTDDVLVGIIYGIHVSDGIDITDAVTFVETLRRAFSDVFLLYDNTAWGWGFNPSTGINNVGLTDNVKLALTKTPIFTEEVSLTDDVVVTIKREVQVSDVTGLSDNVNLVATFHRTIGVVGEDVGLVDEAILGHTRQLVVSDHTGLVDTFLRTTTFAIILDRVEEFWKMGGVEENWRLEELYSEPG